MAFLLLNVGGTHNMKFRCPVCLFAGLAYPPSDYHICPCCGTEFGNDDTEFTHEELVRRWIDNGAVWFYENPPEGWSPWSQLIDGGRMDLVLLVQQGSSDITIGFDPSMLDDNVLSESNAIQNPLSFARAASMIG
jgi:hypothetical protein